MDTLGRYRGSLLGLAAGDALGTTLEFKPPGTFEPHAEMTGGGPFGLEPGEWTDDTSMALCLAESLIEREGFDPIDQLERYVRWYRHGHLSANGRCFDIGNTTVDALWRFEKTREPYCGSTDRWMAGNGSLMRLAPVPLFHARDARAAIERAGESSRTTHGAAVAVDACRYLAALIAGAVRGATKDELLAPRFEPAAGVWAGEPLAPEIDEVALGSFREKDPPQIRGNGYAARSLEAALWAFDRGGDFREGMLLAVNLGDDADTTGAIYGQLAGAHYGERGIPAEWLAPLALRDTIESYATRLHDLAAARPAAPR